MSVLEIGDVGERDEEPVRQFVNGLSIRISLSAVNFDFRAMGMQGGTIEQVWKFTTTPTHFKSFHARLGEAIENYRARFGEIPPIEPEIGIDDGENGRG